MALPVTLDMAKRQLRILSSDSDPEIEDAIKDAAAWVEDYTGHLLEAREITERFASFERVRLAAWPIAAEPVSVFHSGVPISGARLASVTRPGTVLPALNTAWPRITTGDVVEVTYTAGYASADDVPRAFVRAMLVLVGGFFNDREGGEVFAAAEMTAKRLCRKRRVWQA